MIYKSVLSHFKLIKEQKIKLKKSFKKSKELLVKSTLNISEAEIQTGVFNSFFLEVYGQNLQVSVNRSGKDRLATKQTTYQR